MGMMYGRLHSSGVDLGRFMCIVAVLDRCVWLVSRAASKLCSFDARECHALSFGAEFTKYGCCMMLCCVVVSWNSLRVLSTGLRGSSRDR